MKTMIYCVCRKINTQKVDAAAAQGARTPKCVLAHYGESFNCGKCAVSIQERLAEIGQPILEPAE